MSAHLFLAFTNPAEGRRREFDEWYERHHLPEILSVPGFVSGQRFELAAQQRPGQPPPPWQHLVVYEYEGDIGRVHERLAERRDRFTWSEAVAPGHVGWVYSPIGERRVSGPLPREV